MDQILAFLEKYPTVAVALVLLALLTGVLKLAFSVPVRRKVVVKRNEDELKLEADLTQWASDLRLLGRSLLLGRWHDVSYAMCWCTVCPPSSLTEARDWLSTDACDENAVRYARVCGQAEELAATAVLIDGKAMLPAAAVGNALTVNFSASDYARAVFLLADEVGRLCVASRPIC